MATAYKTLGQSNPAATTETVVYTVPSSTSTVVSSITVCNQASTVGSFRVGVSVGGGALAATDYIYYDLPIAANDTFILTGGVTLATTDEIRVYASSASLSFNVFGSEIT